jgi:predicted Na+-dependent transporter
MGKTQKRNTEEFNMAEEKEKKGIGTSLAGGLLMTIVLVIVVPVIIGFFIAPIVEDFIGDTSVAGLTSGTITAIVLFIILVLFMLLLGGGRILKKFGVIGIVGLILAYILLGYFVDPVYYLGWILPVIIVALLAGVSFLKDKKKDK